MYVYLVGTASAVHLLDAITVFTTLHPSPMPFMCRKVLGLFTALIQSWRTNAGIGDVLNYLGFVSGQQ